ncbi:hypothetical protein ACEZI3_004787 [Escherichia coli]
MWKEYPTLCWLVWINGQIPVFDQGMTGGRGLLSKFVSIIGQVVIFVLVADPQSAWPFRSFVGPASGSQCLCYSAWLCVKTRFNRRRCRGSDSDPGISG